MRDKFRIIKELYRQNRWILLLFLSLDLFYFISIWLMDDRKAYVLAGMILLLTVLLLSGVFFFCFRRYARTEEYLRQRLEGEETQEKVFDFQELSSHERYIIRKLETRLQEKEKEEKQLLKEKKEQREYIETWVHEIKTPISLMALILDNREEEMSREVYQRLGYANGKLQEYVDQILYYSRLHSDHKDFIFQEICLEECIQDIIADYQFFLKEKEIQVLIKPEHAQVFTDRKGLEFILGQVLSNAIAYLPRGREKKEISFTVRKEENRLLLFVKDNGIGVKPSDLPFVFEKGFSGDNREVNKKTTGMGLYLVKKMADSLNLSCEAESEYGEGFCVILGFPMVSLMEQNTMQERQK